MTASKSFFDSLNDLWKWLWGSEASVPPEPQPALPDAPPPPQRPRVLLLVFNPVVEAATGKKLIEVKRWNDPEKLAADYIADVAQCSGGLVQYQIVERIEADEIPRKADGYQYTPQQYLQVMATNVGAHAPDLVDYDAIISRYDLLTRVTTGAIDEVWLFGAPYFGFWEAAMAGKGAFFCNGGPIQRTDQCPRKFVLMGFNYERGVGEMLEDLGHRAETILARVFRVERFWEWAYNRNRVPAMVGERALNLYERFMCFEQIAPGKANVGSLHYAPNSGVDYEWGNPTPVQSCADDWLQFPDLPNPPNYRPMTTREWGGGDIRAHHQWWLARLPKAAGATDGIANNWWRYVIDPNTVE